MVDIIGHRGSMGFWPENTISGFIKAAEYGMEFVELDVQLSSDDICIVMHDLTIERTSHGTGLVRHITAAELTAIELRDAGGEKISTLDTVLAALKPLTVGIMIELKTDPLSMAYPGMEQKIIDLVDKHQMRDRVRFISFVPELLETVREIWPEAEVAAPIHRAPTQMYGGLWGTIARFMQIPGCICHIEKSMLKLAYDEVIKIVPTEQLGVGPINEEAELRYWLQLPFRQMATNFPDRAAAIRNEVSPK